MGLDSWSIGDTAQLSQKATDYIVRQTAEITNDYNPIHLDDSYAANTPFKRKIAHGVFCVGIVSALLGTVLPGPGTIIMSQTFHYLKPVYIGDIITAKIVVKDILHENKKMILEFSCSNQVGDEVMTGYTEIKMY